MPRPSTIPVADDGSRSIAIVRRMKQLREDLKRGQIGELTFFFEFGALERALEALRITRSPRTPL